MSSDRKPRICLMTKGENGYGFHLHGEKGKSGQFIRKVEPGSPAEASGLRAGDRVVAVNGVNVEKETHHQASAFMFAVVNYVTGRALVALAVVVQRIKAVDNETRLLVVDLEAYERLRNLRLTVTEDMAVPGIGPCFFFRSSGFSLPFTSPRSHPPPKRSGKTARCPSSRPRRAARCRNPPGGHHLKLQRRRLSAQVEGQTPSQPQSQPQVDPSELVPRLCHLVRSEMGYGFNLHSERSRPGQYIRSLDPGSPADHAGLRPQDRLVEVNGVNIESMRHAEVVAFIKKGGDETWLLVVDPDTDENFKRRGVIPTVSHLRAICVQIMMVRPYPTAPPTFRFNGSSTSQSIRSTHSDLSSQGNSTQLADDDVGRLMDPFAELGLSATAAEEKMKVHAKEKKKAPQMTWLKKYELFSNF
ncbi:Na(+)/H(+) exchange regulatory cofactor NHE-RF2 [Collichthys lucidus]|uniref:Na(+)/H(+) exchange regulatory cofactor NHE-RF2 n=1 Tax=Collichthys lucidus TaxID=240159 RepID=A0A4U5VT16_COLLU|nr:Na(+)/H(+) exchange regulatory cofactor NHE-RF2 [Collichthys lucidus]